MVARLELANAAEYIDTPTCNFEIPCAFGKHLMVIAQIEIIACRLSYLDVNLSRVQDLS